MHKQQALSKFEGVYDGGTLVQSVNWKRPPPFGGGEGSSRNPKSKTNQEKNSRSGVSPPTREAQVYLRKLRLPGNMTRTVCIFSAHRAGAPGAAGDRGSAPAPSAPGPARERTSAAAPSHTWLPTPVESSQSE